MRERELTDMGRLKNANCKQIFRLVCVVLRMELWIPSVLGRCSTIELHPWPGAIWKWLLLSISGWTTVCTRLPLLPGWMNSRASLKDLCTFVQTSGRGAQLCSFPPVLYPVPALGCTTALRVTIPAFFRAAPNWRDRSSQATLLAWICLGALL